MPDPVSLLHEARPWIHLLLHALVPLLVALAFWRERWRRAFLVMVGTMVVDLDHLLARPLYDPDRCSILFHPLHSGPAIALWVLLALIPKTRLIGVGLVLHMALDGLDCAWMQLR